MEQLTGFYALVRHELVAGPGAWRHPLEYLWHKEYRWCQSRSLRYHKRSLVVLLSRLVVSLDLDFALISSLVHSV